MVLYWFGDRPISVTLPDATEKERDFIETSFFAASPGRQLPTPTQVKALSKDVHTRAQPTPIKYKDLGLIVKFGPHVTTTEALNLWMIKKIFGDDIPVPELFGWRVDDEGYVFIYMELVEGHTLEESWDHLSLTDKTAIKDQLSQILSTLRKLTQDPSDQFIGMVEHTTRIANHGNQ